jgi:hypothetical protein
LSSRICLVRFDPLEAKEGRPWSRETSRLATLKSRLSLALKSARKRSRAVGLLCPGLRPRYADAMSSQNGR